MYPINLQKEKLQENTHIVTAILKFYMKKLLSGTRLYSKENPDKEISIEEASFEEAAPALYDILYSSKKIGKLSFSLVLDEETTLSLDALKEKCRHLDSYCQTFTALTNDELYFFVNLFQIPPRICLIAYHTDTRTSYDYYRSRWIHDIIAEYSIRNHITGYALNKVIDQRLIGRSTLYNILNGKLMPSYSQFEEIAVHLKIKTSEVYSYRCCFASESSFLEGYYAKCDFIEIMEQDYEYSILKYKNKQLQQQVDDLENRLYTYEDTHAQKGDAVFWNLLLYFGYKPSLNAQFNPPFMPSETDLEGQTFFDLDCNDYTFTAPDGTKVTINVNDFSGLAQEFLHYAKFLMRQYTS